MKKNKKKIKSGFPATYITVEGIGGFQEKFISGLISEDIQIYSITQQTAGFTAVVKPNCYLKMSRIARKNGVWLWVIKR